MQRGDQADGKLLEAVCRRRTVGYRCGAGLAGVPPRGFGFAGSIKPPVARESARWAAVGEVCGRRAGCAAGIASVLMIPPSPLSF